MKIRNVDVIMVIVEVSLLALFTLSTTITNDNFVLSQSPTMSNNNLTTVTSETKNASEGLNYDTENMTHRSAKEEWRPHLGQTNSFVEWWYFTALLHDAAGNKYMLFDTIFKYDSKENPFVAAQQDVAAKMGPEQAYVMSQIELSNYNEGFHFDEVDWTLTDRISMWDINNNNLVYNTPKHTGLWGYDGKNLLLTLKSQKLSFDLHMQRGNQVMWAKDRTYNKEGFIQQGLSGNVSFYYSLPRLIVSGHLTYTDESGSNKTIEVEGQGWVDRQWGDFLTYAWEWASWRFNNGARVNMYNFDGHQVGTYQNAEGSTQWFDNFIVKQNGYAKTPNGLWFSWGWSYGLPIEIEGSKNFTIVPFSKNDTVHVPQTNFDFYEGAGKLIDDTTEKVVGSSIDESMDIRLLRNGPYDQNQH